MGNVFEIDGRVFDYSFITQSAQASTAQSWTLASNMNYFHPFHIHVNPFQVKEVFTGYIPGVLPTGQTFEDALKQTVLEPANQYRDTVLIPPFGMVTINQKIGGSIAWTGKTVIHCHFLDHEDQGMIAAMMINNPNEMATNTGEPSDETETSSDSGYRDHVFGSGTGHLILGILLSALW
jgi:FtsP/CotA-like multicopper oxidase with cupredoxin domain